MLLDTSGLLALVDAREPKHQQARAAYADHSTRVTHGFVLAELVALGNARGVPMVLKLAGLFSCLKDSKCGDVISAISALTFGWRFFPGRWVGEELCDFDFLGKP
jgi:predicted nucleic acid-binding protein